MFSHDETAEKIGKMMENFSELDAVKRYELNIQSVGTYFKASLPLTKIFSLAMHLYFFAAFVKLNL